MLGYLYEDVGNAATNWRCAVYDSEEETHFFVQVQWRDEVKLIFRETVQLTSTVLARNKSTSLPPVVPGLTRELLPTVW